MLPKIGNSQSLSEQAYEAIKKAILTTELKPRDILREEALAASLGISRTPLRAALKRLEFEKLITVDSAKHTYVAEVNTDNMIELFVFRFAIEPMTARVASLSIDEMSLGQIEDCLRLHKVFIVEGNLKKVIACELEFSNLIARSTGNEFLSDSVSMINTYTQRFITLSGTASDDVTHSIEEHRMIYDALKKHSPDEAEERTRHHLGNVVARFGFKLPL